MRLSKLFLTAAPFALAGVLSLTAAGGVVNVVEDSSELSVRRSLDENGLIWAEVHANGLQVFLTGVAPSEALRFRARSIASTLVDAARVIDGMSVADSASLKAPHFSIEILRNDSGISLIGLVPTEMDRARLLQKVRAISPQDSVSDLLQTADYDTPGNWASSVQYALDALHLLPRSKISVQAGEVSVRATSDSIEDKHALESRLNRAAAPGLNLILNISAPRPVITPFTLRFVIDENGPRFDACSADNEAARSRILKAAGAAGLSGKVSCTIGLGVPSPRWAEAAERSIAALAALGPGTVTLADADISFLAEQGTDPATFDRVIGELENTLPDIFSLHASLPAPEVANADLKAVVPEFTATLSPEGLVQLRGRLNSELLREATESFAQARFGSKSVHNAARLDDRLPASWPLRVLTGLSALSLLSHGAVIVTPDTISVSGNTGRADSSDQIAGLFAEKLGDSGQYDINVTYLEQLDPIAGLATPEECEAQIGSILLSRKINFEPGSDTPDSSAQNVLNDIAEVLRGCPDIKIEIGGHTDSQGRESMNQALSQSRAQAVLNALRERRLLTSTFTAKGFGESLPIATNDTEEGRETNRRIEFKLIRPAPIVETQSTLESLEGALPAPLTAGDESAGSDALTSEEGTQNE